MSASSRVNARGVTLIELALVIAVIPILLIGFFLLLTTVMNDSKQVSLQANADTESLFASSWLERDLRNAVSYQTTVSAPYTDPYQPSGGWSYSGSGETDRVLIAALPATTLREGTPGRVAVYAQEAGLNCTTELFLNPIHTYRAVYFVDDNTLYKRHLTDTTTTTCGTQIQRQSCPEADRASWPAVCDAPDEVVANDVIDFRVDYVAPGTNLPLPDQYTGGGISVAKAVRISLVIGEDSGKNSSRSSRTIFVARAS